MTGAGTGAVARSHGGPARPLGAVRPRRRRLAVGALAVIAFALFWVRVLLGDFTVTIPDFFRILLGADIPGATFIVMESKLPRAVLSVLVGFAFGVAGAVFQSVLRNPLASPDIIGISIGASASACVAIVLLGLQGPAVAVAAVLGALACALVVRLVAGTNGTQHLVLAGIGISAGLLAVVHFVFVRAAVWDAQALLRWLTGSVSAATWSTIGVLVVVLALLLPWVWAVSRHLRALELGDDVAASFGVGSRHRDLLLGLATVLAGVAVAASGPIAFVAFMAGPLARLAVGGRTTLLGAGFVGAALVVGGDHVGDYLLADVNFPVGVVTGALGAPFLLWLLATGGTSRRPS